MSRTLVVVYSYTGTCLKVAQLLGSQQGWDVAEVVDAKPRDGSAGTRRCVLDSWLRRRPAIRYTGPAPEDFDTVVLVAPIWLYRLAGPMRSFVHAQGNRLPTLAVISVMGGRGAPNAVAEIGRITGRSPMFTTAFQAREVDDGSFAGRLQAFGDAISAAQASSEVIRQPLLSPQAA